MLANIADRLSASPKLRHLLFLGAAVLAILISGYHFGTFDQVFYIPYLKKYVDPTLYPGDPYLDLRYVHFTYFWSFFQVFYRWGVLEPVMLVVHFLATYATFWMFWGLSDTLFKNPLANLICVVTFIFPHIGLSGFQVIEFSLLNRTFVFPFLLAAIILYLRRRYLWAFFLLGLMYNLHVVSVNFILVMLVFDSVMRFRQVGWRNISIGLVLFTVGAFPVLYWRNSYSPIDLTLRPELLDIVSRSLMETVYYMFSRQPVVIINTLGGVACLIMFIIAVRRKPSPDMDRIIINFFIAIGIVLVIQVVSTYWLPVTIILQLQILRIGFYILIFSYLYFANYLAIQINTGSYNRLFMAINLFAFSTFVSPLLIFTTWLTKQWYARYRPRQYLIVTFVAIISIGVIILGIYSNLWSPGLVIYGPKTDWVDVQKWAKANTPKEALFITPPQLFLHYIPDWRVFSERSTVVSIAALLEIPFAPDYLPGWMQRFNTLAPGAVNKFNGDYFTSLQITSEAFYKLTSADLEQIAINYNASYLVVEKPHAYSFSSVYENKQFIVYDLTKLLKQP